MPFRLRGPTESGAPRCSRRVIGESTRRQVTTECILLAETMRPEIQQAVELLSRRDHGSVEKALSLIQSTVYSFSMRVCGQREDAEDTMQEVLMQSMPYLPKFNSPNALLIWLYKVAKTRCLMSRRRSKFAPQKDLYLEDLMPDRQELDKLGTPENLSPETFAIDSERAKRLQSAIQKLPPEHRIILVLRDMEGLTDQEVAEVTGLRPGTIRVRLHRARLFVRKEMVQGEGAVFTGNGKRQASSENGQHMRPAQCKKLFSELSDYLDDKLDDSLCEELVKHFDDCKPCRAFLATLEGTIRQCRNAPSESPDRQKAAKIRAQVMSGYATVNLRLNGKDSGGLLVPKKRRD